MTLYRNILSQGWKTTWRNKYLWFFGLFAALLGNGGVLEIIFRGSDSSMSQGIFPSIWRILNTGIFSLKTFSSMGQLLVKDPISLFFALFIFIAVIALTVFLIWLIIVSQSAIVHNSANIITSKEHDFKGGLEVGMKKFWPVLGYNAIVKLIIYIVFVLISLPILMSIAKSYFTVSSLVFVISFIIFIPFSIILSFIAKYAIAYTVIKGNNFISAIQSGWRLFTKNWLVSLEMAFILFFVNFLVGLSLLLLFLILSVPLLFLALVVAKAGMYLGFWVIVVLSFILFLAIISIIGAGLATFQISSWTGLFIELVGKGGTSKLVRIFSKE